MRPLHESVAKEKSAKISLIEAENEANNELLASFSTKISGNLAIFTRYLTCATVSVYMPKVIIARLDQEICSKISFVQRLLIVQGYVKLEYNADSVLG